MTKELAGREPIEIIEIEQDFCALSYADSNCNAELTEDQNKCFNTLGTCGSPDDYTADKLTLKFCSDQKRIPEDGFYFPFLRRVRVRPAEINPGSANRSAGGLGKRATISAQFSDHPSTDRFLDPYYKERISGEAQLDGVGYDPFSRSTFWRKWRARNLYYLFRPMRYISGYLDEDGNIVDAITQHFVITKVSGPDNTGRVSIEGKDILSLAQTEKAEAPRANSGKLSGAMTAGSGSLTLIPFGIGDIEYSVNGWVRVGEEVMSFTRAGDVMTLGRGQFNTAAAAHDAGETVQECINFQSKLPYEILYTLLNVYSGIDDSYLDLAQWFDESVTKQFLPLAYSAIITEPTPVQKLINEMTEQMYFYTWFDTRASKVLIRAVRPLAEEEVNLLNYSENIIADSVRVTDKPEQIISRVVINYALYNPAKDLEEPSNYRVTDVFANLDLESEDKNRVSNTKTIFSRWLTSSAGGAALELGNKLIARYAVPPEEIAFSLDAKDRDLWTGDFAQITSPFNVDSVGEDQPIDVQIMGGEESTPGTVFSYRAQRFRFELPPEPEEIVIIISANENNVNLRSVYDALFPVTPPESGDVIRFEIQENVIIGSTTTASPALNVGSWPAGVDLTLKLRGGTTRIIGKGGAGGSGGPYAGLANGSAGGNGGQALFTNYPIKIENNGLIGGGGGGGGGGGASYIVGSSSGLVRAGGGGGGGGFGGAGSRSTAQDFSISTSSKRQNEANGGGGSEQGGAGGGVGAVYRITPTGFFYTNVTDHFGGKGGRGGNLGQAGSAGSNSGWACVLFSSCTLLFTFQFGVGAGGGAPGAAINGSSQITWIAQGTIRGAQIS